MFVAASGAVRDLPDHRRPGGPRRRSRVLRGRLSGLLLVLGAAIAINLLRVFRQARLMAAETEVTSGTGLRVPLRDMRILPGKAVAPPPAIESADGQVETAADLDAEVAGVAETPLPSATPASRSWPSGASRSTSRSMAACCAARSARSTPSTAWTSTCSRARSSASSASRAAARRRSAGPSSSSTPPTAGRVVFDGYELADVEPGRHAAAPAPDADHLPGPVRVAQPADAGQRHHRRGPPRPGRHGPQDRGTSGSRTRSRSSGCGATTPAATRTSSAAASASASASPAPWP